MAGEALLKSSGLLNPSDVILVTADTNDILSSSIPLRNAGPGVYKITALAAAASDGTITINDGSADVVSAGVIPVKAASVTYPNLAKNEDHAYYVRSTRQDRIRIDILDGTNAEIVVLVEKVGN